MANSACIDRSMTYTTMCSLKCGHINFVYIIIYDQPCFLSSFTPSFVVVLMTNCHLQTLVEISISTRSCQSLCPNMIMVSPLVTVKPCIFGCNKLCSSPKWDIFKNDWLCWFQNNFHVHYSTLIRVDISIHCPADPQTKSPKIKPHR